MERQLLSGLLYGSFPFSHSFLHSCFSSYFFHTSFSACSWSAVIKFVMQAIGSGKGAKQSKFKMLPQVADFKAKLQAVSKLLRPGLSRFMAYICLYIYHSRSKVEQKLCAVCKLYLTSKIKPQLFVAV